MDAGFSDLIPVFLEEARERLERLAAGVGRPAADAAAAAGVRRELHTLKGSARMLGLDAMAELCHAAEDALAAAPADLGPLLVRTTDRLAEMVETLAAGESPRPDPDLVAALRAAAGAIEAAGEETTGEETTGEDDREADEEADQEADREVDGETGPAAASSGDRDGPRSSPPPVATPAAGAEIRVDAAALDEVADRATQLRLMARAAGRAGERLYELARLAEKGLHETDVRQILAVLAAMLRRTAVGLEGEQRLMLRAAEDQLERLLGLQLQPLRGTLQGLARNARRLAASLGKQLEVELEGEETRLDRRIARDLSEALLHLVRNAVDHGLETPEARRAAGKAPAGRLRLTASTQGPRVRLEVADDGPGVDPEVVRERAIAAGLVEAPAAAALDRGELLRLLFAPGFSTRPRASEISGRGVGLDVVAAAVERVGGEVFFDSRPGAGSRAAIEVPVARRGEQVMVLALGEVRLAIPSAAVRAVRELPAAAVVERDGRTLARLGGRLVPFVPLARLYGEPAAEPQLLLEGSVGGQALALAADDVEGEEEVLVRPLPRVAGDGRLLEGIALLASGRPVGVLSPAALARRELTGVRAAPEQPPAARRVQVLLVEDSLVTREMERRLLEDAGFAVAAAGDADEALARLAERRFDCVVTDVEMPGMDGFELTRRLRSVEQLAQLPIVVVSTRDRPEDRLRGLRAGADAYLTKQALDAGELVDLVRRLAGR